MRAAGLIRAMAVLVVSGCLVPSASAKRGEMVYEGIERHGAQVSTMWVGHASSIGKAVDGTVTTEAQVVREREEARAARAHQPSTGVCEGVEGFRWAASTRAHETGATEDGGDALVAWLVRDTARAPGLSAPSDLRARFDEVLERYCAPGRVVGAGIACTGEHEDHAADLQPGAVLGVATFANEKSVIAGIDWARNVAMPVPEQALALRAARSEAGRRVVLERRGRDARAALAMWYLHNRVSARVRAVPAGDWAASIGVEDRGGANSEISRHELLGGMARGRYEPPGFFARHQAEDRANLLREWIVNEAASLQLAFEAYRDDERQGAMLAARLAQALLHRRQR